MKLFGEANNTKRPTREKLPFLKSICFVAVFWYDVNIVVPKQCNGGDVDVKIILWELNSVSNVR